jgi:hypothetical protein
MYVSHLSRVTREALSPVNFSYMTEGLKGLVDGGEEGLGMQAGQEEQHLSW